MKFGNMRNLCTYLISKDVSGLQYPFPHFFMFLQTILILSPWLGRIEGEKKILESKIGRFIALHDGAI
jgi:hypothetical protein